MKNPLNEDVEIRRKAVEGLIGKSSETAVPLLLKAMEDVSWRVRKAASSILIEEHPLTLYITGLIQLLHHDENAGARNSAIETLIRLGKKATPFLMETFDSTTNRDVRKFIIDITGESGDKRALSLFLRAIKDDDENVRAAAVEYLGNMGEPAVVDELIEMLKSGNVWIAFPAAHALGRIGNKRAVPPLIDALSVKTLREPVIEALGHFKTPEVIENVIPFLTDKSRSVQEEAMKAVDMFCLSSGTSTEFKCDLLQRLCGPKIVDRLIYCLSDKKLDVRMAAIHMLGLLQSEKAIEPMLELFMEEKLREDVKTALISIVKSKPGSIVPLFDTDNQYKRRFIAEVAQNVVSPVYRSVFERLLTDPDGHVRALAAKGLSYIGDRSAVKPIKKLLTDPYEDVQDAAVASLSRLKDSLAIEELIGHLKDRSPVLRKNAALLLGKIGAVDSVNALGFALKDEDITVRQAVVKALSSIKTDESVRYLIMALTDESPEVRALSARSMGSIGGEGTLEPLLLLLNDSDDAVRSAAIRSLGVIGDRRAVRYLSDMLVHDNGFIVTSAIDSLGKLGGDEARNTLVKMLDSNDKEIKRTAIMSLSNFEGVEDIILPYLNDQDWATRVAAIEALSRQSRGNMIAEVERLFDTEDDPVVRKAIEENFDVR